MKNTISLFLTIALLATLTWQCQSPAETETPQEIYLIGEVENSKTELLYLQTAFGFDELRVKDGAFMEVIPADRPQMLSLSINRDGFDAYARPGDTIRVKFDESDFEGSFTMESPLEKENEFLNMLADTLNPKMRDSWSLYGMDEAKILETTETYAAQGLEMLEAFQAENTLDETFIEQAKVFIQYETNGVLASYPQYHKYIVKEDSLYEPGPDMEAKLAELERENPQNLGVRGYTTVLNSKKHRLAGELMEADTVTYSGDGAYLKATIQAIKNGFENPELVEFLTFDHLNEYISFDGIDKVEAEYQNFITTTQKAPLVTKLKANYGKWAHLKAGMPAPDFTYPDIYSLIHSLSDFKGQYVYIDVWATWCGPCIAEQPYLEKIEEEYADNENILFMGVPIDADKAAWKKMVKEKEMYGVQLIAEDAWNSKINQDYLIKGIPRFILVDPDGNLVSANAHRPSSDALKEQLKELLDLKPVTG